MERDTTAELAAARRTIDALMRQVEVQVASGQPALTALQRGAALERLVAERTAQLAAEHAALSDALERLGRTQADLLQAQKLQAVGQLAAGIAHEINTPVQFVADSVDFAQEAFRELAGLLPDYARLREAAAAGNLDPAVLRALAEREEEVQVDYLLTQVPKALERALEGLRRVATIVRAMRDFAHPDDREKVPADLNAALRSTIVIARNEYKYVAEVATDLGELPPVPCHVGELNQVFLNLLVNAAHAIDGARPEGKLGHIRVESRLEEGMVRISVADDGAGIPEGVRDRVFEPFFTTKGIGKGSGQGLAIAWSVVVEKHGGSLTFDTEPGRGTTFHVRIPLAPRDRAPPAGRKAT